MLQLADLGAHSWLADRQGIGSGGDTAQGSDFDEDAQCVQVHGHSPFITFAYESDRKMYWKTARLLCTV